MTSSAQSLEAIGLLPLKHAVYHILLALSEGDAHGYGVIQIVRRHSEGHVHLPTGAFYRHLGWAMKRGLVEESPSRPESDDPRRGAYYRLTRLGREVLGAESDRLAEVVAIAREKGLVAGRRSA